MTLKQYPIGNCWKYVQILSFKKNQPSHVPIICVSLENPDQHIKDYRYTCASAALGLVTMALEV